MLQTRNGKRTGLAAVRFAIEMEKEKLIDWKTAIRRVPADQLDQVLAPIFDRQAVKAAKCIARGLPAGPGAASGKMYLNADRAAAAAAKGEKVLLVRNETSPEDLRGMIAAEGILTAKGGVSSHAALVARQMGKVCVCGASALQIDYNAKTMTVDGSSYKEGDFLSISGTVGEVYPGEIKTAAARDRPGARGEIARWKGERHLPDVQEADGLVLEGHPAPGPHQCRHAGTNGQRRRVRRHGHRPVPDRAHVLRGESHRCHARNDPGRQRRRPQESAGADPALPETGFHRDLQGIERAAGDDSLSRSAAARIPPARGRRAAGSGEENGRARRENQTAREGTSRIQSDAGSARLPSRHPLPEISAMQARAIFEAAIEVQKEGIKVKPEIMIPLVGFTKELELQVALVRSIAAEVSKAHNTRLKLDYMVGTMIEIPRGVRRRPMISPRTAEFFSFGTNDLTQTCLGMSRDDSGSFLPPYIELEIVKKNPFATIDQDRASGSS
jgi:pyruvate,orthophosphate dikinase